MDDFQERENLRNQARSSYTDLKKHYVRKNGWLPIFQFYYKQRKGQIRYFTLCAKRAIDVRYFRDKGLLPYNAKEKCYPTVTFIESDSQDYAVIMETLGKTRMGIRGSLENILLHAEDHPGDYKNLRGTFPQDIINLDFTGNIVPGKDQPYSQTLRAIEHIISIQHQSGAHEWHMFLTFQASKSSSNQEAIDEIKDIIECNLQNQPAITAYGNKPKPSDMIQACYHEFLRIGVAKFIAGSATKNGYAVVLGSCFFYERKPQAGNSYYIVKLVIGFQSFRTANQIPNTAAGNSAYQKAVPQIFQSAAIDVYGQLGPVTEREVVKRDLQFVLSELDDLQIID